VIEVINHVVAMCGVFFEQCSPISRHGNFVIKLIMWHVVQAPIASHVLQLLSNNNWTI